MPTFSTVVSAQVCKRQRLLTKTATVWFLQKRPINRMETTVADELRIGLSELLRKAMIDQDADFLKEGVRVLSQALMEMEIQEHVGAGRHERTAGRTGQRNGYRERSWDTRVGTVELKVPRVRDGGYFPSLLEPRRKAERALSAVVQEAYVHGVSTRKVDELVKALGMTGISKSQVSELCEELDEEVERFRNRPLKGAYPYVWVDATYLKARQKTAGWSPRLLS
jgi:putative transposase